MTPPYNYDSTSVKMGIEKRHSKHWNKFAAAKTIENKTIFKLKSRPLPNFNIKTLGVSLNVQNSRKHSPIPR